MARGRMIPTRFFKDPDIMNLSSKQVQLILVGLILAADDEGRELAHAAMLGREMDFPPEQIEAALEELVNNDLLIVYQVGRHRYYSLTRWQQWQHMGKKYTPSKYPAPPEPESVVESDPSSQHPESSLHREEIPGNSQETPGTSRNFPGISAEFPEKSGENPEFPGKSGESPSQSNLIQFNLIEDEEKHENQQPNNVTPFPTTRDDNSDKNQEFTKNALTCTVASILKIAVTPALTRIIDDFGGDSRLSLPGEADAAREWIDDESRNKKGQEMTPAFFRRWLKREVDTVAQQQQRRATGTTGGPPTTSPQEVTSSGLAHRSLMNLEKEYRAQAGLSSKRT